MEKAEKAAKAAFVKKLEDSSEKLSPETVLLRLIHCVAEAAGLKAAEEAPKWGGPLSRLSFSGPADSAFHVDVADEWGSLAVRLSAQIRANVGRDRDQKTLVKVEEASFDVKGLTGAGQAEAVWKLAAAKVRESFDFVLSQRFSQMDAPSAMMKALACNDVRFEILRRCNARGSVALESSCRAFQSQIEGDAKLWASFVRRDFPSEAETLLSTGTASALSPRTMYARAATQLWLDRKASAGQAAAAFLVPDPGDPLRLPRQPRRHPTDPYANPDDPSPFGPLNPLHPLRPTMPNIFPNLMDPDGAMGGPRFGGGHMGSEHFDPFGGGSRHGPRFNPPRGGGGFGSGPSFGFGGGGGGGFL